MMEYKGNKNKIISVLNWDKIENKNYKESLKSIFEKQKNCEKVSSEVFNENEYSKHEASLLKFVDVYKHRPFLLKHKM